MRAYRGLLGVRVDSIEEPVCNALGEKRAEAVRVKWPDAAAAREETFNGCGIGDVNAATAGAPVV